MTDDEVKEIQEARERISRFKEDEDYAQIAEKTLKRAKSFPMDVWLLADRDPVIFAGLYEETRRDFQIEKAKSDKKELKSYLDRRRKA